jgi:2-succinyl-6-hydroxy-2,4-cyclohexadiene-1-carboxylate synthase
MDALKFQILGSKGGPALVCLHGFLGTGSDWLPFAEEILRLRPDVQILLPDLPGHGESVSIPPENFVECLVATLDSAAIPHAAFAGYSLGGRLALTAALNRPDRFPVFLGISTTAGIDDEVERARRIDSDAANALRLRLGGDFEGFLRDGWPQPVFASPARKWGDVEEFVASRRQRDPLRMAACLETWSSGMIPSKWSGLMDYPGRALLLSGDADGKYTSLAARMQFAFQDAERLCIAGAGHQLLMDKPEGVAIAVAAFLNQHK